MRSSVVAILWLGAFFTLSTLSLPVYSAEILWSQYCQHLGKMKLLVHLDSDPTATVQGKPETVRLWLREDASAEWKLTDSRPIDRLTATALFKVES